MLYNEGSKKCFCGKLLTFLKEKRNDKVQEILEEYQLNEKSPTFFRLRDSSDSTLLHYASQYGNEEIAKLLIDSGSDVDAQDNQGRTPLVIAVKERYEKVVDVLLGVEAKLSVIDCQGRSTLPMILEGPASLNTISKIFQKMNLQTIIDIDLPKNLRDANCTLSQVISIKNNDLTKLCLQQGHYAVNEKDGSYGGRTVLHTAVGERDLETVKLLVEYGADVDALNGTNSTPLSYLYSYGRNDSGRSLAILKVLMSRATSLTSCYHCGWMQVYRVLANGCKEAVELVLQRIDNLDVTDRMGNTVVHYVAVNSRVNVIKVLTGRTFNLNARNEDGYTPLHLGVERHMPHVVEFFLEKGANIRDSDAFGRETLNSVFEYFKFCSDYENARKCIQLLLKYGSNVFNCHLIKNFELVSQNYDKLMTHPDRLEYARGFLTVMEPILAQLAVSRARDVEISETILSKIALRPSWVEYFDMCKRQVDQMSKTTIHGNVTLFKFFIEGERNLTAYMRNEELVSELKKLIEEFEKNSPYLDVLLHRFEKATQLAELNEKAIAAVWRLIGRKDNALYFSAEYIVEYLSNEDKKNLHCIWNKIIH